jgi:diguanylate cyclase (GGDEF)-like protein
VVTPLEFGEGDAGLLILGKRMTDEPYAEADLALLRSIAEISAIALRNAEMLDRLRAQASLDTLTGCFNRRACDEFVQTGITRATRFGHALCLILLEIDNFQELRNHFGDEAADNALQRVGRAVRYTVPGIKQACRYDGAEFALVLEETEKRVASQFAERIRITIEALPPNAEVPRALTASVGIAVFPDNGDTPREVWRFARMALYLAQTSGGNRVK